MHIGEAVHVAEQVQEKQAWRVITGRAFGGVTIGYQGADKGEIDQWGNHFGISPLDRAIGEDFNELFFELIIGEQGTLRERLVMGKRNFKIDFVDLFAYYVDGSPS